ncbi:MAG: PTS sugar transporter subunit IIC [Defluviitaleaceae bacterium]|nr:PTS sugar transporter subunit IIC [Defluviitaleaceae bacterium]
MAKVMSFMKQKDVTPGLEWYFVKVMSVMTFGLFSSLIIGLILRETGTRLNIDFIAEIGAFAMTMTGAAIGASVAYALKSPPLVIFATLIVGQFTFPTGDLLGAFIVSIIAAEAGKLISKETKVDIIVTPVIVLIVGAILSATVSPPLSALTYYLSNFITTATEFAPFFMGLIIALIIGMALSGPISSAALAIMVGLDGIAAGAATAGAAAQMIGFAIISYRENKISGLISHGLGTSMIQFPNIVKNPLIWIPTLVASAVGGVLSTMVFRMENIPIGAGMGTSGLVGQFGTVYAMGGSIDVLIRIGLLHFIIPAVISLVISEFMRKKGYIKFGDMAIETH